MQRNASSRQRWYSTVPWLPTASRGLRHQTVAENDFVLTLSEGSCGGAPFAFYDLFRVADAHAVEHWDVMTAEPAPLPHDNGLY